MFDIIDKTEICAVVAPAGKFFWEFFVTSLESKYKKTSDRVQSSWS